MPALETPVLTVDANTVHRIDTRNVENLFSIWALFSRCSVLIEHGRRLENLSWRLWNRETSCCAPGEMNATTPATSISQRSSDGRYTADVPDLSGSLDSLADEKAIESDNEEVESTPAPVTTTRSRVRRQDSGCNRNCGKERHITADDLELMVITIEEKKDLGPLTMSTHSYLVPLWNKITTPSQLNNTASPIISAPERGAENASPAPSSPELSSVSTSIDGTSATSECSTTIVVRGFSPSQISSSYRSIPLLSAPTLVLKSALASSNMRSVVPKKHAMCGSSQSNND